MNAVIDGRAPVEQRNFALLVSDIGWFGLALAATRFLSVFAIRLGASPIELGLISALPSLVMLLSAGFGVRWLARFRTTRAAIILPASLFRLSMLLPMFAPFLPEPYQPIWLIAAVTIPALGQGIGGTVFLVRMRQSVSDGRMAKLMSRRSMIMNLAIAFGALAFGYMLEALVFPLNYQLMFVIAFICTMFSLSDILRLRPLNETEPMPQPKPAPIAAPKATPWQSQNFRSVALFTGVLHLAFFAIAPITPLFLVNRLGASEGFMAIFSLLELLAGAFFATVTPRLIRRYGTQAVMAFGMIITAVAALLIALATALPITLLAAVLTGAGWTFAATVGLMSYFMERTPNGETSTYSMAFHQAIGLTMFIGPMIGSVLVSGGVDLASVLLMGAALRVVAAVVLAPRAARGEPAPQVPGQV